MEPILDASGAGLPSRRKRHILLLIVVAAVVLVALRAGLPWLVRDYLNKQMADMGAYRGHVATVDIDLWRGAYTLGDLDFTDRVAAFPVPLLQVDAVDLAVSWSALLGGAVVADVEFHRPELNFVDDEVLGGQTGGGTDWQYALQQLVPIEINRLAIHDGSIHFRNFSSEPAVDLVLSQLNGAIDNISNADRSSGARPAAMRFTGIMLDNAETLLEGQFDPLGDFHNFSFRLKITGIDLQRLNTLSEAYGNFDFESGNGDFLLELEARDGKLEGYAKPLLDNVTILDVERDLEKGIFSAAWEAVVAGLGRVFRNQPENRIASRIEIRGSVDQQDISAWQAFISILRNAFVDAYQATFEPDSE